MPEESKLAEKLEEKQSEITFTEEEMKQVKEIKNNYLSVQYSFGQVKMARIRLDQQEIDLESALTSLQAEEQKFLDGITEKYGD